MLPLILAELQDKVTAYLETISDDPGDEWDYKAERSLTYRESAQQTLDRFLSWLNREYGDTQRD